MTTPYPRRGRVCRYDYYQHEAADRRACRRHRSIPTTCSSAASTSTRAADRLAHRAGRRHAAAARFVVFGDSGTGSPAAARARVAARRRLVRPHAARRGHRLRQRWRHRRREPHDLPELVLRHLPRHAAAAAVLPVDGQPRRAGVERLGTGLPRRLRPAGEAGDGPTRITPSATTASTTVRCTSSRSTPSARSRTGAAGGAARLARRRPCRRRRSRGRSSTSTGPPYSSGASMAPTSRAQAFGAALRAARRAARAQRARSRLRAPRPLARGQRSSRVRR